MTYLTNLGYNKKTILIIANAGGFLSSLVFISWCAIKRLCFKQRRHWIKAKKSELETVLFGPAQTSGGSTPSPPIRKRRAMRRTDQLELQHRPDLSVDRIIEVLDWAARSISENSIPKRRQDHSRCEFMSPFTNNYLCYVLELLAFISIAHWTFDKKVVILDLKQTYLLTTLES